MNRPISKWRWDDVRFFLAAAREGSLSGAARVLGVDHVTVGRRLAFLEGRLGVKLLNRTPDGYAVTSAGQAILRQSAAMEAAALDLERAAAGRDLLAAGSVRITTTEALADRIIVPAIAPLRKSHSDLHVVVLAGVRSLDIARREADLAVRFARPTASEVVLRSLGKVGVFTLRIAAVHCGARQARARKRAWRTSLDHLHRRSGRDQHILLGRVDGKRQDGYAMRQSAHPDASCQRGYWHR